MASWHEVSPEVAALRAELMELQDRRCGICGVVDRLMIDHDHVSGMVRGLLCVKCNFAEGTHPVCRPADRCPVCLWRATPSVAWLGRTVVYRSVAVGEWEPSWSMVVTREAQDVEAADVMARILDDRN